MTSLNRQDRDLHCLDGSHRSTPPSASGHQIDLWHRRLTRHMEAHMSDEPTYKIVRFYRDDRPSETVVRKPDPDEPSWDSREVELWISSTEGFYHLARSCRTEKELRICFEFMERPDVEWGNVDWVWVWEQINGEDE